LVDPLGLAKQRRFAVATTGPVAGCGIPPDPHPLIRLAPGKVCQEVERLEI